MTTKDEICELTKAVKELTEELRRFHPQATTLAGVPQRNPWNNPVIATPPYYANQPNYIAPSSSGGAK